MYIYIVEYLGAMVAFRTVTEAEKYIEIMYGDGDSERIVKPTISPCLMAGDGNE